MKCDRNDILDIIRSINIELSVDELDPTLALGEQGVDSLDMMNIFFGIEERFGVNIDENALEEKDWDTVDAIAASVDVLVREKAR